MSPDLTLLLQLVINGVVNGCVYALVALGLVMIHRVTRIINFAHSEFYMVGAYVGYTLFVLLEIPFPLALVIAALVVGLLGAAIDVGVVRSLRDAPLLNVVMTSLLNVVGARYCSMYRTIRSTPSA